MIAGMLVFEVVDRRAKARAARGAGA